MKNITHRIEGQKLIIEVDLTQDHGPSSTGKTTIVASTQGIQKTSVEGISFGLNVMKKREHLSPSWRPSQLTRERVAKGDFD